LARTNDEENIAAQVRLAEAEASGNALSVDFKLTRDTLMQSESVAGAHHKVISLVDKFKGVGRDFFCKNI